LWSKIYSDEKAQTLNHRRTRLAEMPLKCMCTYDIIGCIKNCVKHITAQDLRFHWNIWYFCFWQMWWIGANVFAILVWFTYSLNQTRNESIQQNESWDLRYCSTFCLAVTVKTMTETSNWVYIVLRSSDKLFRIVEFFSEKIILRPREVQISWFLVSWSMTHYILRLVFFRDQPTPPICLKMPKCAKFSTFWLSHEKNHLQVGVHRENFLIGNLAQNVFMVFYICWEHNISFSAKFPMRKFSPSPSPSPSSLSHLLLQNWLKFRK